MQVMETRKKIMGPEHPSTLTSMHNLAYPWKYQGRDHDAMGLMSECIRLRMQKLGQDHPNTRSSVAALDRWQAEIKTSEQAQNHPDTSSSIATMD